MVHPWHLSESALKARAQGTVISLVSVDRKGMPTGCRTIVSAADTDLDQGTCAILLRRARYVPTDDATNPRWSIMKVTWIIS